MIFFVLSGAMGFCVFMAMSINNMLITKINKNQKSILVTSISIFAVIIRGIPSLNTFTGISVLGALVGIFFIFTFKSIQKAVMCAVFGMALFFGIEGVTLLISRLFQGRIGLVLLSHLYIAVLLVVFLLSSLLRKFLETRKAMNLLNSQTTGFLLISASLVLIFTYKSFALENTRIPFGQWAIGFGDVANFLFLTTSIVMFVLILRYVSKETTLRTERLLVEGSKKYVQDLEESYQSLRTIKHDYVNIMTTFKLYLDNEDMAGLKKYYNEELSEMNKGLLIQDQLLTQLQNVTLSEIKSILIYKGSIATDQGIDTELEIKDPIHSLGVSTAIVCQMLGILLDNAIEAIGEIKDKKSHSAIEETENKELHVAIQEAGNKKLHIAIVKNPTSKVFIIKNTWEKKDIPINKLFELGFSTKGGGRGIGLHTARNYTEKLKGLYLETEITEDYFIQTLTVKDD